jgi:hypothetical protein
MRMFCVAADAVPSLPSGLSVHFARPSRIAPPGFITATLTSATSLLLLLALMPMPMRSSSVNLLGCCSVTAD